MATILPSESNNALKRKRKKIKKEEKALRETDSPPVRVKEGKTRHAHRRANNKKSKQQRPGFLLCGKCERSGHGMVAQADCKYPKHGKPRAGTSQHRPKKTSGIRFGEAENPGPRFEVTDIHHAWPLPVEAEPLADMTVPDYLTQLDEPYLPLDPTLLFVDSPRHSGCCCFRPKNAANGIRFGEASNPGPGPAKNKKGKVRGVKKENASGQVKKITPPVEPTPVEQPKPHPPPPLRAVVVTRVAGKAYYGLDGRAGLVADRGNQNYYDSRGEKRMVWHSDELVTELIGWKEVAPGSYVQTLNEQDITCPRPAFELETIPAITIAGLKYPAADCLVCIPLVNSLRKKFTNPALNESNLRACLALATHEYPSVHAYLVSDTVRYFLASVYLAQQAALSPLMIAMINSANMGGREFVQPPTASTEDYMRSLGQDVDHGAFRRLLGVADPNEQNTTENGLFSIDSSRGYNPIGDGIAGKFVTGTNSYPKLYLTQTMGVKGTKDFLLLDKTGDNVSKAMSRLYKARENDELLRANQAKLAQHAYITPDFLYEACSNSPEESKALAHQPEETGSVGHLSRLAAAQFVTRPDISQSRTARMYAWLVMFLYLPIYYLCAFTARLYYVGLHPTVLFTTQPSTVFRAFPKKKIYQAWYHQITGHTYGEGIHDPVEAKFKTELAKPGKNGRLYVTYGRSILYSGWLFDTLKKYMCGKEEIAPIIQDILVGADASDVAAAAPPSFMLDVVKSLDEGEEFEALVPTKNGLSCQMFSDDMRSVYVTENEEVLYFDTDISSCDAGNTFAMFYLLGAFMYAYGFGMYVYQNFKRLRQKITIRNPSNPKERVVLKPKTIFQGSGCPETTVVNNIASICISISFYIHIAFSNLSDDPKARFDTGQEEVRTAILRQAATAVGHLITVDWRLNPAESQFLKHSPLLAETGERVNCRNLGAILRNLGRFEGDLSARQIGVTAKAFRNMSHATKAEIYISNVVKGLVHEPSNVVIDALRARFSAGRVTTHTSFNVDTSDRAHFSIPITSLQERYGGDESEWLQLGETIRTLGYGQIKFSALVDRILEIDYGL